MNPTREFLTQRAAALFAIAEDKQQNFDGDAAREMVKEYADLKKAMQSLASDTPPEISLWREHCRQHRVEYSHTLEDLL